ncbi:MAG: hypothetical protein J6K82_01160 [Alphaproteobacteria bacterium]|nr:hypothetical protein [Alphaproteobacteria bacterium]
MKKLIPLTSLILLSAGPSFADVSGFFENIIVVGQKNDNISDQEKWAIEFKQGLYGERNINGVELTTLCILGACPNYDVKCIGENHDKCAAFVQGFLGREQETTTAPSVTTVSATSETPTVGQRTKTDISGTAGLEELFGDVASPASDATTRDASETITAEVGTETATETTAATPTQTTTPEVEKERTHLGPSATRIPGQKTYILDTAGLFE